MHPGERTARAPVLAPLVATAVVSTLVIAAILVSTSPSRTAISLDPFADVQPMNVTELARLRGGLNHPDLPFGMEVSMGGNIRTLIDGTVVLETTFNVVENTLQADHVPGMFDGLQFVTSANAVAAATGGQVVVPDGLVGVVLSDEGGATVALHRVDLVQNQIANIVIAGSPDHNVTQTLSLTFEIAGFGNLQSAIGFNRAVTAINDAARAAALNSLSD